MKKIIAAFFLHALMFPNAITAQDTDRSVNIALDTRFDYTLKIPGKTHNPTFSGFDGKFLNIIADGNINDKFSYNYRQRLFLDGDANYRSFFKATDWMYLTYKINRNLYVSGGKQVVAIGGFEYDAAPIDQYFWSVFWNNVICYQLGVTGGFKSDNNKHHLAFQITNSPLTTQSQQGIYAYNLIWYGNFNHLNTIYSVNRIEYEKNNYINYIALGNRFNIGPVSLELDLMSRFGDKQNDIFSDYTVIGKLACHVHDNLTVFTKVGYDENTAQATHETFVYDRFVKPGTKRFFYGGGVEYFPIKGSNNVRLHGYAASDNNDPRYITFNVGVRWKMNILKK